MHNTLPFRSLLLVLCLGLLTHTWHSSSIPVTRLIGGEGSAAVSRIIAWDTGLDQFRASVTDGDAAQLVGVYVPQTFAFPVVQQPKGYATFVSTDPGVVTQFGSASGYGTVGLLAHNNLAGAKFYNLHAGQMFFLVYGDGRVAPYTVDSIRKFQALSPEDPYSNFIDLDHPAGQLTSGDVFAQIYTEDNQVVFQTCLGRNGNPSWGRIFVSATPLGSSSLLTTLSYQAALSN
jgi:hypothetical protein